MPPTTFSCRECALRLQGSTRVVWSTCDPDTGFCSNSCMGEHMQTCVPCFCSCVPRPRPHYALALVFPVLSTWRLRWVYFHRLVPTRCQPSCNECIVCETCHRCGPIDRATATASFILECPSISGIPRLPTRPTIENWQIGVEDGGPMVKIYALPNTETHIYPVNLGVTMFTSGRQEAWTGPLLVIGCSKITCRKECRVRDITMDDVNAAREFLATTTRRAPRPRREIVQHRDRVLSNILDNMLKRGTT